MKCTMLVYHMPERTLELTPNTPTAMAIASSKLLELAVKACTYAQRQMQTVRLCSRDVMRSRLMLGWRRCVMLFSV